MNNQGQRFINALAYVGILFFLPLLFNPKSKISRFHANHGLVILLLAIAGNAVISLFPLLGGLLYSIYNLVLLILAIIGILNALNSNLKPLPIIGGIHLIN